VANTFSLGPRHISMFGHGLSISRYDVQSTLDVDVLRCCVSFSLLDALSVFKIHFCFPQEMYSLFQNKCTTSVQHCVSTFFLSTCYVLPTHTHVVGFRKKEQGFDPSTLPPICPTRTFAALTVVVVPLCFPRYWADHVPYRCERTAFCVCI